MKQNLLKRAGLIGLMPLAAVGIAGGVVLAQSGGWDSSPTAGTATEQAAPNTQPMDDYIKRLAGNLGIGEQQLRDALKKTSKEEVDAAEAAGKMTTEMADKLRAAIEAGNGFFGIGGAGMHGRGGGPGGPRGDMGRIQGPGASREELATFLGITPQALSDELKDGTKSLAEVALAHGKSRDELKKFVTDTSNARIDQLQTDGRLTAEQATAAKKMISDNVDMFLDARGGKHTGQGGPGFPGGRRGPGGMTPGQPGTQPTQPTN